MMNATTTEAASSRHTLAMCKGHGAVCWGKPTNPDGTLVRNVHATRKDGTTACGLRIPETERTWYGHASNVHNEGTGCLACAKAV